MKTFFKITTLFTIILFSGYKAMSQETQVMYFGHTGYTAKINHDDLIPNQSAFNTGGFNFFVNSQLNDKLSVLGEFFMGFKGDGGTLVDFNIERLYFKYAVNGKMNLRIGRMYTPMGFWNNQYTQGIVFQPTINRPYAVRNANDKGILATNSVGLQVDGEDLGALRFSYYLMVDNTTGANSLNTDVTTNKSYTAKVKFYPFGDFQVFSSFRLDHIAAGSNSIQGIEMTNNVDQSIFNVGFAHMTILSNFEAAFEYFRVSNDVENSGTTNNDFMYGYLGYRINKVTPYVQFDVLGFADNEEYFVNNDLFGLVVGTRYAFVPNAVIKGEYKFRSNDTLDHQDVFSVQVSARF